MVYIKIKFSVKHNIFENKRWMNVFVIMPIKLPITLVMVFINRVVDHWSPVMRKCVLCHMRTLLG